MVRSAAMSLRDISFFALAISENLPFTADVTILKGARLGRDPPFR
jgi:hypothetical protein